MIPDLRGLFRHYKGSLAFVEGSGYLTGSDEPVVTYWCSNSCWRTRHVRSLAEWNEEVEPGVRCFEPVEGRPTDPRGLWGGPYRSPILTDEDRVRFDTVIAWMWNPRRSGLGGPDYETYINHLAPEVLAREAEVIFTMHVEEFLGNDKLVGETRPNLDPVDMARVIMGVLDSGAEFRTSLWGWCFEDFYPPQDVRDSVQSRWIAAFAQAIGDFHRAQINEGVLA